MSANDKQVGGDHYKTAGAQHWDVAAYLYGEAHFKCTATKYISRWRVKNGVQDLEKAKHYLEKLLELESVHIQNCLDAIVEASVEQICSYVEDYTLIIRIFEAEGKQDLRDCIQSIDVLIAGQNSPKPA